MTSPVTDDARLRLAAAALQVWSRVDRPSELIDDTAFRDLRAALRELQAAAADNG